MDVGLAVVEWCEFGPLGSDQSRFSTISPAHIIFIYCRCYVGRAMGCVLPLKWFCLERFAGTVYMDCSIDFCGSGHAAVGLCLHHTRFNRYFPLLDGFHCCLDWI